MAYNEVVKSLERGVVSPVYLIHGEERYLINSLTNQFKKHLLQGTMTDFNYDILDENSTPGIIVERVNTLPVMAQKRLVIVKNKFLFNASKKKAYSEKDIEVLLEYLKEPNTTTCLVFSITEKADGRTKLFKAIKKTGTVIRLDTLKDWEVTKWIEKHCLDNGKGMDKEAVNYLFSAIGNNLEMLDMELQKLYSYVGNKKNIKLEDVKAISSRTLANNIFELVDALAEGESEKAVFCLRDMILAGEPEIRILFMIIRQYRLMLQAKLLHIKGYTINTIIQKTGWHPFVAKKVLQQSRLYSSSELEKALQLLMQLDIELKTSQLPSNYLLETAILRLSKGA
ncbi:MAG: polymerase delta subunit [Clostridiales bacterium]|nr:polymerase delta subunit [Clostridiales bacterium]